MAYISVQDRARKIKFVKHSELHIVKFQSSFSFLTDTDFDNSVGESADTNGKLDSNLCSQNNLLSLEEIEKTTRANMEV